MKRFLILVTCFLGLLGRADAVPYTVRTVNLAAGDLAYDRFGAQLYASTAAGGGSLTAINPFSGTVGGSYVIGGSPGTMVISDNGTYIHAVVDDSHAVQRFNLRTQAADLKFTLPGDGQYTTKVRNILAVPGRPDMVVIARTYPAFSPPADGTWVYQNGVTLPDHIGGGLGTGGPDIITLNETGDRVYGYENSISSFGFLAGVRDANGVHGTQDWPWGSMISGYNVGRIAVAKGKLFTDRGEIKDLATANSLGSFSGGGNFLLDADYNQFYSVSTSGSTQTLRVYDLDSLFLKDSITLPGISGTTNSLTRFGADGLAFRTSAGQVVLVESKLVPEPGTLALLGLGGAGLLLGAWRRKRRTV